MSEEAKSFWTGFACASIAASIAVNLFRESQFEQQAISAGVARYEVNPTTGKVSFVWITNNINQVTK